MTPFTFRKSPILFSLCIIIIIVIASVFLPDAAFANAASAMVPSAGVILSFSDVSRADWAYVYIRKLAEASIINGDTPKHAAGGRAVPAGGTGRTIAVKPEFRPDDMMSREECAVIVARLEDALTGLTAAKLKYSPVSGRDTDKEAEANGNVGKPQWSFVDVPGSRWSYEYIERAKKYIGGYPAKSGFMTFMPEDPILRGDFVTALIRLTDGDIAPVNQIIPAELLKDEQINGEWIPYITTAIEKGVLLGDADNGLQLNKPVTRRETCALIVRALENYIVFPEPAARTLYIPETDSGFYDFYFDGAVFVGDSITLGLRNYVLNARTNGSGLLGNARFLCVGSYGLKSAAGAFNGDGVNLSYQGIAAPLEDCLWKMGANEAYIMLGMNDWAGASLPGSIEMYEKITDKIYDKNPGITIYIQFCTPITQAREATKLNNKNTDKFNAAIVAMCEERGIDYVDVSTPLKDENNALKREYANDGYVHMSQAGCEIWIKTLREFVKAKYAAEVWGPPDGAGPAEAYPGSLVELD